MGRYIYCALTVLTLAWYKPTAPIWMGAGLLMLVVMSARYNFSAPSPKYRRSATKRMALLSTIGIGLVALGTHTDSSIWGMSIASPAEARYLMSSLLVYCVAILGAPTAAWAYMIYPKCPKKRKLGSCKSQSLPVMARNCAATQAQIAV